MNPDEALAVLRPEAAFYLSWSFGPFGATPTATARLQSDANEWTVLVELEFDSDEWLDREILQAVILAAYLGRAPTVEMLEDFSARFEHHLRITVAEVGRFVAHYGRQTVLF